MAVSIIPLKGALGGMPLGVELARRAGLALAIPPAADRHVFAGTPNGFLSASTDTNGWYALPVAADLTENSIEVLLRVQRIITGSGTTNVNIGGGITMVSTKDHMLRGGYYATWASGTGSSSGGGALMRREPNDTQASLVLLQSGTGPMNGQAGFMRFRREGNNLKVRMWAEGVAEPATWTVEFTDATYAVRHVGLLTQGYTQTQLYTDMAVATAGDTASLSEDALPRVYGKFGGDVTRARVVEICDYATHIPFYFATTEVGTGDWSAPLLNARPIYARTLDAGKVLYDLVFARGFGYLAGKFPDGITTVEGVPSPAKIRVLLRTEDGNPLSGAVVAETTSGADGTWEVPNLNIALLYDVVARRDEYNDMIMARIVPAINGDAIVYLGTIRTTPDKTRVLSDIRVANGTAPYSLAVDGPLPAGVSLTMVADTIAASGVSTVYGSFTGQLVVTDANGKTLSIPYALNDMVPTRDVFFLGGGNALFTTAATTTATSPPAVALGDTMYAFIFARSLPVTPPAGWTLIGSTDTSGVGLTQYGRMYKKVAVAADVGGSKPYVWTVSGTAGRVSSHIIVMRSPRPLVESFTALQNGNKASPYLTPSAEATRTGMAIAVIQQTLASTTSSTMVVDAPWTVTSPVSSTDSANQIRLGVAYRMIEKGQTIQASFTPNTDGVNQYATGLLMITCP